MSEWDIYKDDDGVVRIPLDRFSDLEAELERLRTWLCDEHARARLHEGCIACSSEQLEAELEKANAAGVKTTAALERTLKAQRDGAYKAVTFWGEKATARKKKVQKLEKELIDIHCLLDFVEVSTAKEALAAAHRKGAEEMRTHLKGIAAAVRRWEGRIQTTNPKIVAIEGLRHVRVLVSNALDLPPLPLKGDDGS